MLYVCIKNATVQTDRIFSKGQEGMTQVIEHTEKEDHIERTESLGPRSYTPHARQE